MASDITKITSTVLEAVTTQAGKILLEDNDEEEDEDGEWDNNEAVFDALFEGGEDLLAMDLSSYMQAVSRLKNLSVREVLTVDLEKEDTRTEVLLEELRLTKGSIKLLAYYLVKANPNVTRLRVTASGMTPSMALILGWAIRRSPSLEHVEIEDHKRLRHGIAYIARGVRYNPHVTTLSLRNNKVLDRSGAFGKLLSHEETVLEKLDVGKNNMLPEAVALMAEGLTANRTLVDLNVDANSLSVESVEKLALGLGESSPLSSLSLKDNNLGREGLKVLQQIISDNPSIEKLDIGGNKLGDDSVRTIIAEVASNPSISNLGLAGNQINAAAIDIARMLSSTSSLAHLDVSNNPMSEDNAIALCAGLQQNDSLKSLNMSLNKLVDGVGLALAETLELNNTLESVQLGNNLLTDTSVDAFASALQKNSSLEELDLSNNSIKGRSTLELSQLLHDGENTTLKTLGLDGNPITTKATNEIKMANSRGVAATRSQRLNITVEGTHIMADSLSTFGVRLPKSETHTTFSKVLLGIAVITNWLDVSSDVLVAVDLYQEAQVGTVSYVWFAFCVSFLALPTLYISIFMATPENTEHSSCGTSFLNSVLSVLQLRIAYEAIKSAKQNITTTRFGAIRVVEAAVESGPQAFLQLTYLMFLVAKADLENPINPVVAFSVVLSLLVLGQTFSDLFEKQYIVLAGHGDEGFALFRRLIPCWIFHICQFLVRVMTIGIAFVIFDVIYVVAFVAAAIAIRCLIKVATKSDRSWTFCVVVTFLANSAWDRRRAVALGLGMNTIETALLVAALWLHPGTFDDAEPTAIWAADVDFEALNPQVISIIIGSAYAIYVTIFFTYIYPLHSYEKSVSPEALVDRVEDKLAAAHLKLEGPEIV